jgi:hypothetical protein
MPELRVPTRCWTAGVPAMRLSRGRPVEPADASGRRRFAGAAGCPTGYDTDRSASEGGTGIPSRWLSQCLRLVACWHHAGLAWSPGRVRGHLVQHPAGVGGVRGWCSDVRPARAARGRRRRRILPPGRAAGRAGGRLAGQGGGRRVGWGDRRSCRSGARPVRHVHRGDVPALAGSVGRSVEACRRVHQHHRAGRRARRALHVVSDAARAMVAADLRRSASEPARG